MCMYTVSQLQLRSVCVAVKLQIVASVFVAFSEFVSILDGLSC